MDWIKVKDEFPKKCDYYLCLLWECSINEYSCHLTYEYLLWTPEGYFKNTPNCHYEDENNFKLIIAWTKNIGPRDFNQSDMKELYEKSKIEGKERW